MRAVPRRCEFYPGICLTTEEKSRMNLSQGKKNFSQGKKTLSQVKKNLSQSTVYIYQNTHTLQNPHKHTHYKTHTYTHAHTHILQNNIKPPWCTDPRTSSKFSKILQLQLYIVDWECGSTNTIRMWKKTIGKTLAHVEVCYRIYL